MYRVKLDEILACESSAGNLSVCLHIKLHPINFHSINTLKEEEPSLSGSRGLWCINSGKGTKCDDNFCLWSKTRFVKG